MMTNNIKFLPRTCKEKERGLRARTVHLCRGGGVAALLYNVEKNPMGSNHISIVNLIK